MKFFLLDFPNRMSCKNCNGVMLVNIFFKIFFQFFKIRVECYFKDGFVCSRNFNNCAVLLSENLTNSVAEPGGEGAVEGYIDLSTKMPNKENTTLLALLRLFVASEWTTK